MDNVPDMKYGFWKHHGARWEHQLLVTSTGNWFITVAIGVCFGFTAPSLGFTLVRLVEWIRYWIRMRHSRTAADDARRPLLQNQPVGDYGTDGSGRGNNARESQIQRPTQHNRRVSDGIHPHDKKSEKFWTRLVGAIIVAVVAANAIVSTFTDWLPNDTLGLSASQDCGWWKLKEDAGDAAIDQDDIFQAQKERRAGIYQRDCYQDHPSLASNSCSFFAVRSIPYHTKKNTDCELGDGSICLMHYGAVEFRTDPIDAVFLGLNTPRRPRFQLSTKCVPLKIGSGTVEELPPDDEHREPWYNYYLGTLDDGLGYYTNKTYEVRGKPFDSLLPGYSLTAYKSSIRYYEDFWTPVKSLSRPGNTSMTILFISSGHIYYRGPSDDPIFPARTQSDFPGLFKNEDAKLRPIVCIDWATICPAGGNACYPTDEEHSEFSAEDEFVRLTLNKSSTWDNIFFRGGSALVAEDIIVDMESPKLSEQHWMMEMEALFATKLARAQHDAFSIDIGERNTDLGQEMYEDKTPEHVRGKLCGMYIVQLPPGVININVVLNAIVLSVVFTVWLLGLETAKELEDDKKDRFMKRYYMVFDVIIVAIWRACWADVSLFREFWHHLRTRPKVWLTTRRRRRGATQSEEAGTLQPEDTDGSNGEHNPGPGPTGIGGSRQQLGRDEGTILGGVGEDNSESTANTLPTSQQQSQGETVVANNRVSGATNASDSQQQLGSEAEDEARAAGAASQDIEDQGMPPAVGTNDSAD